MLPGRRKTLRVCTYGGVLVFIFFLFVTLQALVTRTEESIPLASINGAVRNFHHAELDDIFNFPADDHRLIKHVRQNLIKHIPWTSESRYNLTNTEPDVDYSRGQSKIIDKYLKRKQGGYFIEVGASEGEQNSVSLFFEKGRNYEGLLIEPYPERFNSLLAKHRKAASIQACVRTNDTGSNKEYMTIKSPTSSVVPCLWMETIMASTGRATIDMLSINVRDQEMAILKTIPYDKFDIRIITVEFSHGSSAYTAGIKYMDNVGYLAIHQIVFHPLHTVDIIFAKNPKGIS